MEFGLCLYVILFVVGRLYLLSLREISLVCVKCKIVKIYWGIIILLK